MKKRGFFPVWFLSVTILYLLAACNPATITTSPTSAVTHTPFPSAIPTLQPQTASPTFTLTSSPPSPTKTPTIIPTLTATLAPDKPQLLLDSSSFKGIGPYIITNADGKGRRIIELPEGGFQYRFQNAVSPDGEWLAFLTGSIDEPYDLALNLLSLSSGESKFVTNLVSRGYPENLEVVADHLYAGAEFPLPWSTLQWNIDDCLIFSPVWSPDGQFLAFSSQIDGPSFDIYLYNVATGAITRKTNGLQVACSTFWSPKGDLLLYETIIPGMNYTQSEIHTIRPEGGVVANPVSLESGYWWQKRNWLSDYDYLMTVQGDGGDPRDLYTINIQTGQVITVWPDTYFAYAYDPENQLFVLVGAPSSLQPENGNYMVVKSYLITLKGRKQMIEQDLPWRLIFRGGETTRFVGFDENDGVLAIDKAGNTNLISKWSNTSGSVSPDYKWLVVYNDSGFQFFDNNDVLVLENREISVSDIFWRPDSQGFFINSNGILYYMDILTQEPVLVDICNGIPECWVSTSYLAWLP